MRTTDLPHQWSSLTLPWPTDWAALFGSVRPIILEIGFGRAAFLVHLAQTYPDHHIVGLEVSNQSLVSGENAVTRLGLQNVRIIHSRAETALHHLFTPGSIARIVVNFPDPWFKSNHHHRRLMQRDTLDAMVSRLAPGGVFSLATDILEYAEMSAALLADTPGLTHLNPTPYRTVQTLEPQPGRVITKYEAKAQAEGRARYFFTCQRNDQPAPEVPVLSEVTLPHIVFQSPLTPAAIVERFQPIKRSDDAHQLHIHVMEAYLGARGASILFEVHVSEPTIEQHTALTLIQRQASAGGHGYEYVLQMTTLGHPRPTDGIHYAVSQLGEWLLSLGEHQGVLHNHRLHDAD